MTHREVLEALSGLLMAMFVAMVSSTIVSTALPRIVTDLHGSQTGYTWVMVATMLAMTATTPLWGKFADLFDKKSLVQIALVIFAAGSVGAALAPSMEMLIGARAVQGLGIGGLTALVQVIIASMVSPRERGRYNGYIGATFATATVSGPLLGGLIVDSPLGWRGCFYVVLPIAVVAFALLQKTLRLPVVRRKVSIDYLGATLLMGGISTLLVWTSLAGQQFAWGSATSIVAAVAGVCLLVAAVYVEARHAKEPIVPLRLFRSRTTTLAIIASALVGLAMFGAVVYLAQYFQLSRGMSPTEAGLMSIFMVGGLMVASMVSGRIITTTGRWKRWLVGGMVLVVLGFGLLGTIDAHTPIPAIAAYMLVVGVGIGATMQNLLLAVQNITPMADLGSVSSVVAFFRTMGGSIGVSVLGAVLAHRVTGDIEAGVAGLVADGDLTPAELAELRAGHGGIPDVASLPGSLRLLYEGSFGDAIGHLFWISAPMAAVALVCVLFIREIPLRTTLLSDDEITRQRAEEAGDERA